MPSARSSSWPWATSIRIASNLRSSNLTKTHGARVDVPPERQFLGFDAFKKAIEVCDVAILATPPGFRPMMFEEAVRQGKNVFMEKPVASDAAGVRKVHRRRRAKRRRKA